MTRLLGLGFNLISLVKELLTFLTESCRSVGTNGELQNNQDTEGNFDDALSSKSLSTGIFEPACDYLRKLDNSWGFTDHSTSFNNFDKHINGFSDSVLCNERLTKLSDLVSTWSIAPPDPDHVKRRFDPQACNISLSPSMDCYSHLDQPCDDHMKQTFVDSTSSCLRASTINSGLFPSTYGHDLKLENECHESETPLTLLRRSFNSNEVGYQIGLENSFLVDKSRYYNGMPVNSSSGTRIRSFADVISFSNRVSKQGLQTSSLQVPFFIVHTLILYIYMYVCVCLYRVFTCMTLDPCKLAF